MLKDKYPINVISVIIASVLRAYRTRQGHEIPLVTLYGMRSFADYCGISYSSLRTTLTRWKKLGWIESFSDPTGKTRYRMLDMMKLVADNAAEVDKPNGFSIAVFSFKKEDEKERYRVREILSSFGFKKLAQNVYINARIDSTKIMKEMGKWNLQDNLFLFDCESVSDSMKVKIREMLELDKWNSRLEEFYSELVDFLEFEGLSDEEIYNRHNYAFGVFYTYFQLEHPAIPKDLFPEDYALKKVAELLEGKYAQYYENIMNHYMKINE